MSQSKKINILQRVLGSFYNSSEEMLFFCPKCNHHKRKMSINISKDAFKCWVCDYHGRSLRKLIRNYGSFKDLSSWSELTSEVDVSSFGDNLFDKEEEEVEQIIDLPKEFISLANKNLPRTAILAKNYLISRGLTRQDFVRWKIGYCTEGEYKDRIIVPSFGLKGRPNYFIARSYSNNWKKYMNPPASRNIIFNHLFVDFDEDIILVEGVFDAIVAGPNALPLLGSTLREESKLFQEVVRNDSTIYLALDPDAEKKSMHLIRKLMSYGIEIYKVDVSPYNDVAEMSKEEFHKRKTESVVMDSNNYLLETLSVKLMSI